MIRKNFGLLIVFTLILLFLYYASYFNSPLDNRKSPEYINYSSDVSGKNGMVVSASKFASQVGIYILREGGNAVDALLCCIHTCSSIPR
jgi:gamma-glutamyltranspeptidase